MKIIYIFFEQQHNNSKPKMVTVWPK